MRILITGATGLVGSEIVKVAHEEGINLNYLTTRKVKIEQKENYKGFYWNPSTGEIDKACLQGVGAIINLAGASVFQPWTESNREKILNSRIDSLNLLHKTLAENSNDVGQLISASAIGIYPDAAQKIYYEDDEITPQDFLGEVVQKWEAAADAFKNLDLRVTKVRTGVALSEKGGALEQLMKPIKFNLGAPLGSGKQWQSWIHIRDLARIYLYLLQKGKEGVYNAVAPNPVSNKTLTLEVAKVLDKKVWLPKVPGIALKIAMGEMSSIVLASQLVSSKKIEEAGFDFTYVNLGPALQNLINKKTGA